MPKTTKTTKPKKPVLESIPSEVNVSPKKSHKPAMYSIPKNIAHIIVLVLVLSVAVGLFVARGYVLAATVNGQPISRWELVKRLESQNGQNVLDSLVIEELIQQEAAEQGVSIPDEDIQQEFDTLTAQLESQGQTLDQVLQAEGLTLAQAQQQVRTQKLLEKLVGEPKEVSQQEIDEFVETNKDFLPEEATGEELSQIAREQLQGQAKQKQIQEYLAALRAGASIQYFVAL